MDQFFIRRCKQMSVDQFLVSKYQQDKDDTSMSRFIPARNGKEMILLLTSTYISFIHKSACLAEGPSFWLEKGTQTHSQQRVVPAGKLSMHVEFLVKMEWYSLCLILLSKQENIRRGKASLLHGQFCASSRKIVVVRKVNCLKQQLWRYTFVRSQNLKHSHDQEDSTHGTMTLSLSRNRVLFVAFLLDLNHSLTPLKATSGQGFSQRYCSPIPHNMHDSLFLISRSFLQLLTFCTILQQLTICGYHSGQHSTSRTSRIPS